jgi:general secretion pathway protein K
MSGLLQNGRRVQPRGDRARQKSAEPGDAASLRFGRRGIALILVLWVLTLLSVLAMEFCFSMRTEINITRNFKEAGQMYFYAQGGIQRAIAETIYRNDPAIHARRQNLKAEDSSGIDLEWRLDGTPQTIPFEGADVEVRVRNESGRINLNRATDVIIRKVVKYFLEVGEQRDTVVDSILDWRDPDDLHRINGAENDYYRSLSEPYDCKNADFDSVEELLLVRGITPELFFGKRVKGEEGEEIPVVGLKDLLTVFSTATKVDINSAPLEVILVLFGIPADLAKRVVEAREEQPFANLSDLSLRVPDLGPFLPEVQGFLDYSQTTPYFSIASLAKMKTGQSVRGLECVVKIDGQEKSGFKMVMWKDILF